MFTNIFPMEWSMLVTLEGLRCWKNMPVWSVAQALHKDIKETMALLRGERQHSLTPEEVAILAQCLDVSLEQIVASANLSYSLNFYHLLTPRLRKR